MLTHAALQMKRPLRGRRLVLVDIENVVGGGVLTIEQAVEARSKIQNAIALTESEQVVIGTSHVGLLSTGLGWSGPRLVARSGENGADLALLGVLTDEHVTQRFEAVVLVSGDGIFTDVVTQLGAAGICVTVVSRFEACSKRLRMAAARTVFLDDGADAMGGVA